MLDELRQEASPACLVARTESCTVFIVEEFVKGMLRTCQRNEVLSIGPWSNISYDGTKNDGR